ncbi:hypothetical protein CI109_102224 [Kwoniella shandongensis]|uniref:Golgi apparatus membrane protein TVP38 n=1 Tax=Kwoniella shandongensis TaxID=1734106 RepID=A0A5M6BYP0_9TREE|nr:uncharacterized protein CI109_003622 [Kwoniella shandongensis]KAA5527968.1 hypothetical protein CI109_003622 [Kwoniella shandongensis]
MRLTLPTSSSSPPPPTSSSSTNSTTTRLNPILRHFRRKPPLLPSNHDHRYDTDDPGVRDDVDVSQPTTTVSSSSSSSSDSVSVLALFKEDYVSSRIAMKELDYKAAFRKALRRHMYKWYAILIIAITLTALITSKHETVVEFCRPVTEKIRSWPGGFMIPVGLLIIVSFPPLVGHEIIGILCGLVWGLWVGFAILAAGTFLGEIATWIAFKWCCQGRAAKFEKKNKLYSALTQLIREKSFMFVLVLRFSAVPGHITTAVSASAGANFWSYLAAAFLTLPKQWTIVYLGKAFGTQSRKNTIISVTTTILTLIGTVIAAVYIYYQMRLVMRKRLLALPVVTDSMVASVTMSEFPDEKREGGTNHIHARRPWLFSNGSSLSTTGTGSGYRTPTRSWSMPGHMNEEEWREWVKELEYEQTVLATSNGRADTPAIKLDGSALVDDKEPTPALVTPYDAPAVKFNSMVSGTSTPMYTEQDVLVPALSFATDDINKFDMTYPPTPTKRGEPSTRPPSVMELTPPRTNRPIGGREIADDADSYALTRGARRPEYGRMRGDSRAALLGRPVDDAALEMGGGSWKREFGGGRARGDSGATIMGRPNLDDLDLGSNSESGAGGGRWKRDYVRSRGESGAALLGRPKDEDLGLTPASVPTPPKGSRRGSDIEEILEVVPADVGKTKD